MTEDTLADFIRSFQEDVTEAMDDAIGEGYHAQYRLGVRRLAKAFFDKVDLFGIDELVPDLPIRDVDAWYAGKEESG